MLEIKDLVVEVDGRYRLTRTAEFVLHKAARHYSALPATCTRGK